MNEQTFLQWIQREVGKSAEFTPRYIIRLRGSADCVEICRELGDNPAVSQSVTPLPLINGISCSIGSVEEIVQFDEVAGIEEDRKPAAVHGYAPRLPAGGTSSGTAFIRGKPFIPWGVRHIQTPFAWKKSTGERIRIGVIDTGIDYSHPDLQSSIRGGVNLIHRHLLPIDDNGHGTHISGTIAASSREGMTGAAPRAAIYAVKAFDHNGTSFVTDIVKGIEWCVVNRLHIINMSFGMKTRSAALEVAVRNACREGLIIVASSGNEGKKGFVDYPARFDNTIAVGATGRSRRIAPFSNKGSKIDIYAPGDRIVSTWLNGKYNELSGTSMATAHVSGVVALMLSIKPQYGFRSILKCLQKSSIPVISKARKAGFLGEVNAARAIRETSRRKTQVSQTGKTRRLTP